MTRASNRIKWIDALKGFAIILVVLGHILDGYMSANIFSQYTGYMYALKNIIYSFHMPLFFIISGFLCYKAYFDEEKINKNGLKKQIINFTYLYFMWSIIQWIVKFVLKNYINHSFTMVDLLLMPIKPMAPYWYLWNITFYYLIVVLLEYFFKDKKRIKILFSLIYICLVVCIYLFLPQNNYITRLITYFSFFYLGFELTRLGINYKFLLLTIIGIIIEILFWNKTIEFTNMNYIIFITGFCLSLGFICLFNKMKLLYDNKLFLFLSKYALEIYVMHCFVTAINRVLLHKIGINNIILNILFNLIISILIPIIVAEISKKLKIHKYLFKITSNKKVEV